MTQKIKSHFPLNEDVISDKIIAIKNRLASIGLNIEQTNDYEEIVPDLLSTRKTRINNESSPFLNALSIRDAVYIVVRNENREIKGFTSLRKFEVETGEFPHFLLRQYRIYYEAKLSVRNPAQVPSELLEKITGSACHLRPGDLPDDPFDMEDLPWPVWEVGGRVAYISDLLIDHTSDMEVRIRPSDLSVFAFGVSMLKWRPHYLFSFMQQKDTYRGLAAMYHANFVYHNAIRWKVETPNRLDTDGLLFMRSKDLDYVLQRYKPEFWPIASKEQASAIMRLYNSRIKLSDVTRQACVIMGSDVTLDWVKSLSLKMTGSTRRTFDQ